MKSRQYLLLFVIVIVVFLISSVVLGANELFRKTDELIQLEKIKEEYENKSQKVPEGILKKIEFATEYSKFSTKDVERCEQEVKEKETMIAKAPKDEKGNPILFPLQGKFVPNLSEEPTTRPKEDIGIIKDQKCAMNYFPPHSIQMEIYNFVTVAVTPYDTLISGNRKGNKNTGVIYHIGTQRGGKLIEEVKEYFGEGKIVFESLENDNNIVIFSYDNGKKGYFDVEKNSAIFEEYHKP